MFECEYNLTAIPAIAEKVIANAPYRILLFNGEMGVGKTTLIKEIIKQLGSRDHVSSPTFSLVNEYEGKEGSIYHFDFYRIENTDEVYTLGIDDYLYSGAWCLIEWPEKIRSLLPEKVTIVDIKMQLNDERSIKLNKGLHFE